MVKLLFVLVAIIVVLAALLLPVIPVKYTELEPHQRTESYTEAEPYQDTETYWDTEPYEATQQGSQPLIDDKPTVSAGQYLWYTRYIDVSDKQQNTVSGKVTETAGYDINFFVFDQKGFNTWKEGGSSVACVDARRIASQDYRFVPDHTDYYCFVLDNGFSKYTNKVPSITATWSYTETVTKYRDVQKTRTVTKYRDVQKTRTVTDDIEVAKTKMRCLLAILLGV